MQNVVLSFANFSHSFINNKSPKIYLSSLLVANENTHAKRKQMVLAVEDLFEMYFQPTVWNLSEVVKELKFNYKLCNTNAV